MSYPSISHQMSQISSQFNKSVKFWFINIQTYTYLPVTVDRRPKEDIISLQHFKIEFLNLMGYLTNSDSGRCDSVGYGTKDDWLEKGRWSLSYNSMFWTTKTHILWTFFLPPSFVLCGALSLSVFLFSVLSFALNWEKKQNHLDGKKRFSMWNLLLITVLKDSGKCFIFSTWQHEKWKQYAFKGRYRQLKSSFITRPW